MARGAAIQQDYAAGRFASYEAMSAREDAVAREFADQLKTHLAAEPGATPLTDEALIRIGFGPGKFPGDLLFGPVLRGVIRNAQSPANGQWHWVVRTYPIPEGSEPKTMADVLALLRVLGLKPRGE